MSIPTFCLGGSGAIGEGASLVAVQRGATLVLDSSTQNITDGFGGRPTSLAGNILSRPFEK
jgi:hypothetical protein